MKNDLTRVYSSAALTGATNGVVYLPIVRDSTLEAVSVRSDAAQTGDAVFEVRLNGVVITGLDALTIADGAKVGSISGLDIELIDGDEIILNLVSGNVSAPVTFNLATDDGQAGGGGGSNSGAYLIVPPGAVADFDDTYLTEAAATNRAASIVVNSAGASAKNILPLLTPKPATEFSAALAFRGRLDTIGNDNPYLTFGLILHNTSNGKSLTFAWQPGQGNAVVQVWDNFIYTDNHHATASPAEWNIVREFNFMRIVDTAANRLFQVSYDGEFWRTLFTGTANAFLTATHCGFFVASGTGNQIVASSFDLREIDN